MQLLKIFLFFFQTYKRTEENEKIVFDLKA